MGATEADGPGKKSYRWIAAGHSCGATLLSQYVSRIGLQPSDNVPEAAQSRLRDPSGLILMSGIYSIPTFLSSHQPPTCPPHISDIYRDIVIGAFGSDEAAWEAASPVAGCSKWEPKDRIWVVLAYSPEDELVEKRQQELMSMEFVKAGWTVWDGVEERSMGAGAKRGKEVVVQILDLKGAHDWVWEDGRQVAEMIGEMVMQRV